MATAEKLAALLVERHDLKPPVDIEQLLREYADVEVHGWSHDCDGLTVFTGDKPRPKVYIRANAPLRRKRFTMAHELGHVICLKARPGHDISALLKQVNGVVGGTLSKARAASLPEAIFGALEQKFRNEPAYKDLMNTEDFRQYLRQKAADVGQKRAKRAEVPPKAHP